jgi:hypothetical protein
MRSAHGGRGPALGDELVIIVAIGLGAERSRQWIWALPEMGPRG